jgi:glycine dehydrogenase subunit 1
LMFGGIHFNEFVIKCDKDPNLINKKLLDNGIQGGLIIDGWFKGLKNCMLFGTTELHTGSDFDALVSVLKEV